MREPNWNKLDREWLQAAQKAYDAQVSDHVLDETVDIIIEREADE